MAYITGDLILDDHYNGFATSVNGVWGAGSVDSGYGQSTTIAGVSVGTEISAAQWATLLARITSAAAHQGTAITSITAPTAGNTISAYSALAGNITAIQNARRNAAANGTDITAGGVGQRTTGWVTAITMTYTITFASAAAARYFFNAGGQIRLSTARSGGSAHAKNSRWTELCTAMGTIAITNGAGTSTIAGTAYTGTNKIGGSGTVTTLNSAIGYYDLTTADQEVFRQYSSTSPYTANYIRVLVRGSVAAPAPTVYVTVIFQDDAADDSIPSSLDVIDGTLQTTMVLRPPSTTYISNSWGTPTMSVAVSGG